MIILYDKSEDKEAKHNDSAEAGSHLPPHSQREAGQDIINTSGCYPTPFSPPANTLILLSVLSKHKLAPHGNNLTCSHASGLWDLKKSPCQ